LIKSLSDDGMHPLQLLAAVANQIRRLLLAKDFIVGDRGRSWSARLTFPQFKSGPFKAVQAVDGETAALVDAWESILNPSVEGKKKQKSCLQRFGSGQKSQKSLSRFPDIEEGR
jgi:DNA polymerase-3 subunit delta